MHIFRHIFLSNYWWQRSDIWSQASYRHPISWEAFLNPSDSYFLEKCAYMFNVYKNQQSRQTGSRNLTGPKTLPTIWYTYMKLMTKNQISAINSKLHIGTPYRGKHFWTHRIPTSCLPTLFIFLHIEHICSFFVAFFSATIDGRNLILLLRKMWRKMCIYVQCV
jgi:hypothetical protein